MIDARGERGDGEPERRAVGERLRTGAGALGVLDQPHDPGERGALSRARHLARSEPAPLTVPATTRSPGCFSTGRDSPVIIDSFTVALAGAHEAVRRDARARPDEHEIPSRSAAMGTSSPLATVDDLPRAGRKQLGELLQRPLRLEDRAHLDPVAQEHDGDERRELLPERRPRVAERHSYAEGERDADGERDERHHARKPARSSRTAPWTNGQPP